MRRQKEAKIEQTRAKKEPEGPEKHIFQDCVTKNGQQGGKRELKKEAGNAKHALAWMPGSRKTLFPGARRRKKANREANGNIKGARGSGKTVFPGLRDQKWATGRQAGARKEGSEC